MYVSFGIQQFVSLKDYVSHRVQETVVGRNLRLARYYRYHLENLAPVDTYLIRTVGAVETALTISHPGFFVTSKTDMDKHMASLPVTAMDMEVDSAEGIRFYRASGYKQVVTDSIELVDENLQSTMSSVAMVRSAV